jgi:tetratricopeptide (TPR) repeat protein
MVNNFFEKDADMVQHTQQSLRERAVGDIGTMAGKGSFQDEFRRHSQSVISNIGQGPDCPQALDSTDQFMVFLEEAKLRCVSGGSQGSISLPISDHGINGLLDRLWHLKIAIMSFQQGMPEEVLLALTKQISGKSSYHSPAASLPSDQEIKEILGAALDGKKYYRDMLIARRLQQWTAVSMHLYEPTLVDALSKAVIYLTLEQQQLPEHLTGRREFINALKDGLCNGPDKIEFLFESLDVRQLNSDEIKTLGKRGIFEAIANRHDLWEAVYCYDGKPYKAFQAIFIKAQEEMPHFWVCPISHTPIIQAHKTTAGNIYSKDAIEGWFRGHNEDPLTRLSCSQHTTPQPHIDAGIVQYKKVLKKAALALYRDAKFGDAEPYFSQLCELHPEDSIVHYNFVRCLVKQEKHEAALHHLEALEGKLKTDARMQSVVCACEAIKFSKQSKPIFHLKRNALRFFKNSQYRYAEPYFSQLCKLQPTDVVAHYNLGRCLMKQEKHTQALAHVVSLTMAQQKESLIQVIKYGSDAAIAFKDGQYVRAKIAYNTVVMIMQGDKNLAGKNTQIEAYLLQVVRCDANIKAGSTVRNVSPSVASMSIVGATARGDAPACSASPAFSS